MRSPAINGQLYLGGELRQGRSLYTFQGDVPDFFYRLENFPELLPWFCVQCNHRPPPLSWRACDLQLLVSGNFLGVGQFMKWHI